MQLYNQKYLATTWSKTYITQILLDMQWNSSRKHNNLDNDQWWDCSQFCYADCSVADMKMTLTDCYDEGKCHIWKGCDILGDSQNPHFDDFSSLRQFKIKMGGQLLVNIIIISGAKYSCSCQNSRHTQSNKNYYYIIFSCIFYSAIILFIYK